MGAEVLWASLLHEQALPALDGAEVGVDLPEMSEKLKLLPVEGLEIAGERAFRNSVYASGGVIGVFISSSCLIMSRKPSAGLLGSSDGSIAERGFLRTPNWFAPLLRLVPWPVGVLSEGRLETRVGVFKAGKVGLAEVISGEVGLGEVTSTLDEVTSASDEIAGDESECILASDDVFIRGCGCRMNDSERCLGRLDGRRLQREVSEPG